jgi:hypothetical protein
MGRPGVDECGERDGRVGNDGRGERKTERIGIGKSGRVETDYLGKCTGGVNAVLRLCGGLRTA